MERSPSGKIVVVPSLSLAPAIPADTIQHSLEQPLRNRHLGQLKDQSTGVPHQTALILISLTCTLRSDQCLTALGRHSRRRKFPRLYARMNRDSLTRLATNRWHDSRVPVQGIQRPIVTVPGLGETTMATGARRPSLARIGAGPGRRGRPESGLRWMGGTGSNDGTGF